MDIVRSMRALKGVNILKMSKTIAGLLYFRLTWTRRDLDYVPAGMGPKFISAREAAGMIPGWGNTYYWRFYIYRSRLYLLLGFA